MTSPTQLKYLEAMGIPVWVSRERIVQEETIDQASNDKNKQTKEISSAESLMETLEVKPQVKPVQTVPPVETSPQAATEKLPAETQVKSSTHKINEIGHTSLHTLFGSGSLEADWMVIGQSPDVNDSAMHQPYPLESGELLNNMLKAVGIEQPREQSYWLNVLKSQKRVENKEELVAAIELNQLLTDKIKEVKPKMILLVGQLAAQNLLQSKEPLARLRLQQHKEHLVLETDIPAVVTYYPSYLLSKPQDKAKTWQDLKLALRLLVTSENE